MKREYVDCTSLSSLQDKETQTQVPEVLDTPEIQEIFKKAISKGLMTDRYEWLKTKRLLAYFCAKCSDKFNLSNAEYCGIKKISWKHFEILFKKQNLVLSMNDIKKTGNKPKGYELVNKIFED